MQRAKIYPFLVIITLFTFTSCGAIIKSHIRKDAENVPTDFGKEKTTILVIKKDNAYNKRVDKIFKSSYTGSYFFITRAELESKYSDIAAYRYILDNEMAISKTTTTTTVTTPGVGSGTITQRGLSSASVSFHIVDRKTNTIHDTGISSGPSWKKILKAFLQKLDNERKKNGGN